MTAPASIRTVLVVTSGRLRVDIVIETADESGFDLWPVLGGNQFTHIPLSGESSDHEIGSAIHAVFHWFYLGEDERPAQTASDYLGRALDPLAEGPTQPLGWGGPRFTDGETTIVPGCCLSIDERHELRDSLASYGGTWLGHGPCIGINLDHGVATITQADDDDIVTAQIQTSESELTDALDAADARLSEFVERSGKWAATYVPNHTTGLRAALTTALAVRPA